MEHIPVAEANADRQRTSLQTSGIVVVRTQQLDLTAQLLRKWLAGDILGLEDHVVPYHNRGVPCGVWGAAPHAEKAGVGLLGLLAQKIPMEPPPFGWTVLHAT